MRIYSGQALLFGLLALAIASVFCFSQIAYATGEENGGTYTGISKERSCTWWLDESKQVSKDDKAEIKKLFEALEKKLEKDGIDSVKFPWKPPAEEEKKAEEKAEKKELTEEQKKWEKEEVYEDPERCPNVVIPSKDDLNIVKIDGVPTGTLFVVRGTFDDPRIEVWRMKLKKEGDEWTVTSREIEYSFEPVYFYRVKKDVVFNFKKIRIDHDLMHISAKNGRFYPMYVGSDKIVGGTVFAEGIMNYKPPRKLYKDWETDREAYQMKIKTERFLGKGKGVEEIKDAKVTKFTFFFSPTNFDKYVKIDGLEKAKVTDEKEFKEAKKLAMGEVDWLGDTGGWGVKLPFKGQPDGEKKVVALYYFPDYDEFCDIYAKTVKYHWIGYYDMPHAPAEGNENEIQLYENRDIPLKLGESRKQAGPLCQYNRPDQRKSMTRREGEYENFEEATPIDRRIDVNVGYKEKTINSIGSTGVYGFTIGRTAIFGKIRATIEMEVTRAGATVFPFGLSFLRSDPPLLPHIRKVVDDRGLDILRIQRFTLVFPPLSLGQRLKITAEYSGPLCARILTSSTYTAGNVQWFPEYGFLKCAPITIVLGVPKPYITCSIGDLLDSWSEGNTNFTRWGSDECIRMASFLYSDYDVIQRTFTKPNGEPLKYMFYYYPKMTFYQSSADWVSFADRHADTGSEGGRRREDRWRLAGKIYKIDVSVRNPESIVTEAKSILDFQQNLYIPLPYKKLAWVMMPIISGFGQGQATMLQLDGWSFASAGDKALYEAPPGRWGAGFWSHESGHQYWGHVLAWRAARDQWFSETFTEHQSGMYMQASRGDRPYKRKLEEWRDWAMHAYENGPIAMSQRRTGSYGGWTGMYHKGPCVLHMLRKNIGDKAFMLFERNLLKSMYWKNAATSDLQEVLEQTLGKQNIKALYGKEDMRWWFDQWIYGMGIPSYEYGYKISGNTAKIRIKNLGDYKIGGDAAKHFRVRIPLWVHLKSGKQYAIPILLTGEKPIEEFEVKLRGPAKKLVLNEFDSVLVRKIKKVKYSKVK